VNNEHEPNETPYARFQRRIKADFEALPPWRLDTGSRFYDPLFARAITAAARATIEAAQVKLPVEPTITINGHALTEAQAQTVRCALDTLRETLTEKGLGDDEHGLYMTKAYLARIAEIQELMIHSSPENQVDRKGATTDGN
jgi:hypothetical protein